MFQKIYFDENSSWKKNVKSGDRGVRSINIHNYFLKVSVVLRYLGARLGLLPLGRFVELRQQSLLVRLVQQPREREGALVPDIDPSRRFGHQFGSRQSRDHIRRVLEPVARSPEYLQGVQVRPDEAVLYLSVRHLRGDGDEDLRAAGDEAGDFKEGDRRTANR